MFMRKWLFLVFFTLSIQAISLPTEKRQTTVLKKLHESTLDDKNFIYNNIRRTLIDIVNSDIDERREFIDLIDTVNNDMDTRMAFTDGARRELQVPPCPPIPPPPNIAMCKAVKAAAKSAMKAIKDMDKKQNKDRDKITKKLSKKAFKKEAKRVEKAWERAKKREEKDIKERMDRVKRDNHAHNEARADRIARASQEEKAWKASVDKDKDLNAQLDAFNFANLEDRMESGHRSGQLLQHSLDSLEDGGLVGEMGERGDAEDRSADDLMDERSERGVHEALGESILHQEAGERGQRMDRVERQQRGIREREEDESSVAERRGYEQDIHMSLVGAQDDVAMHVANQNYARFNTIKMGMGGLSTSKSWEESQVSAPHNRAYWRSADNFAVPLGKQHLRDMSKPHQQVYWEKQLEQQVGGSGGEASRGDRHFVPDYTKIEFSRQELRPHVRLQYLEERVSPKRQQQHHRHHELMVDAAGNLIEDGEIAVSSPSSQPQYVILITSACICVIVLIILFVYAFQTKIDAREPLLLRDKAFQC